MAVMSTEDLDLSGPGGLPDESLLQELANQFFAAPPVPQGAVGGIPSSVAGSGISPSAINQGNSVDLKDPQTSLPDPHFAGTGHVPASVAGSGRSPSAEQLATGNPANKQFPVEQLSGGRLPFTTGTGYYFINEKSTFTRSHPALPA